MEQKRPRGADDAVGYLMGSLAWLVPGVGHFYLGMRLQGTIIFLTICVTFALGLTLGGLEVIDPHQETPWFRAQILAGLPAVLAVLTQNPDVSVQLGHGVDLGQLYTGVAGLLNLLCVVDALMRCHEGVRHEQARIS